MAQIYTTEKESWGIMELRLQSIMDSMGRVVFYSMLSTLEEGEKRDRRNISWIKIDTNSRVENILWPQPHTHTHTHTHIYIYLYNTSHCPLVLFPRLALCS